MKLQKVDAFVSDEVLKDFESQLLERLNSSQLCHSSRRVHGCGKQDVFTSWCQIYRSRSLARGFLWLVGPPPWFAGAWEDLVSVRVGGGCTLLVWPVPEPFTAGGPSVLCSGAGRGGWGCDCPRGCWSSGLLSPRGHLDYLVVVADSCILLWFCVYLWVPWPSAPTPDFSCHGTGWVCWTHPRRAKSVRHKTIPGRDYSNVFIQTLTVTGCLWKRLFFHIIWQPPSGKYFHTLFLLWQRSNQAALCSHAADLRRSWTAGIFFYLLVFMAEAPFQPGDGWIKK